MKGLLACGGFAKHCVHNRCPCQPLEGIDDTRYQTAKDGRYLLNRSKKNQEEELGPYCQHLSWNNKNVNPMWTIIWGLDKQNFNLGFLANKTGERYYLQNIKCTKKCPQA